VRLHLGASVADCVVRDLRARPEHSLVLIPAGGEEACSLEVAFTSYVDPRRAGPRLNVLVQVGSGRLGPSEGGAGGRAASERGPGRAWAMLCGENHAV
jgi:hypothetical protein